MDELDNPYRTIADGIWRTSDTVDGFVTGFIVIAEIETIEGVRLFRMFARTPSGEHMAPWSALGLFGYAGHSFSAMLGFE